MTDINTEVRRIGLIFTCPDKPNLGYLEWNEQSTFTIRDANFNEVDIYHVYDIKNLNDAEKVAIEHFQAVIESGETIG